MNSNPFFTALSPEERIKGSRDPLGLLPIWARLGRKLIGNVTTVSGDLRGWTSLMVMSGLYADLASSNALDPNETAPLYRAEQLIAYSRVAAGHDEVRGSTRVNARLANADGGKQALRLGFDRERRILNNQPAAGVWGQISSPAAASAIIDGNSRRATVAAEEVTNGQDDLQPRKARTIRRVGATSGCRRASRPRY